MDLVARYRLTALALLLAGTSMVMSALVLLDAGAATTSEMIFAIIAGLSGMVILGGLLLHRVGKVNIGVCNAAVVVGIAMAIGTYWWLFLVPVVLGAAIVWFGVVKEGLAAELRHT